MRIKIPGDDDDWVGKYSKKKITEKYMRKTLEKELSELKITSGPNKGKTAKEVYTRDGENYKKLNDEIRRKIKNKTDSLGY